MPTVNTLVVDRADRLGLGQLHQLRGRVGRAGQRAYAYLFHPADRVLSEQAYERLRTIGEHTELGSGFKIAMRDLQIRGAGNLLGRDQSGHIAAVGYDLYVQMVSEAVAELKGEARPEPIEVNLDVPAPPTCRPTTSRTRTSVSRPTGGWRAVRTLAEVEDMRRRMGGPVRPAARARPSLCWTWPDCGSSACASGSPIWRCRARSRRDRCRTVGQGAGVAGEALADHPAGLGRGAAAPAGAGRHLPRRSAPAAGALQTADAGDPVAPLLVDLLSELVPAAVADVPGAEPGPQRATR